MVPIVEDRRVLSLGRIIEVIAPDAVGTVRKTIETRIARWTQEQIFGVVGTTSRTGSGRHRLYRLSEVVLIAIAHRLHEHGLRVAAIGHITATLRDWLENSPGSNQIDRALDGLLDNKANSTAARPAKGGAYLIAFARAGDSYDWRPISPDAEPRQYSVADIAQQEVTITLNLRLTLASLHPLMREGEGPQSSKLRRRRAPRTHGQKLPRMDSRAPRYRDLLVKMQGRETK